MRRCISGFAKILCNEQKSLIVFETRTQNIWQMFFWKKENVYTFIKYWYEIECESIEVE